MINQSAFGRHRLLSTCRDIWQGGAQVRRASSLVIIIYQVCKYMLLFMLLFVLDCSLMLQTVICLHIFSLWRTLFIVRLGEWLWRLISVTQTCSFLVRFICYTCHTSLFLFPFCVHIYGEYRLSIPLPEPNNLISRLSLSLVYSRSMSEQLRLSSTVLSIRQSSQNNYLLHGFTDSYICTCKQFLLLLITDNQLGVSVPTECSSSFRRQSGGGRDGEDNGGEGVIGHP